MSNFTVTDMVNMKINADRIEIDSTILNDLINTWETSTQRANMIAGKNYYACNHDVLKKVKGYYIDGVFQESKIDTNNKVPNPFHQILVNQKVSYITSNPIALTVSKDYADRERYQKELSVFITEKFDALAQAWVKEASNKSVSWVHFYVNGKGVLRYLIVPSEEVIAIYDTQYEEELLYVLRTYKVAVVNDKGKSTEQRKAEWWSKEGVAYYVEVESGDGLVKEKKWVKDPDYNPNPSPHWLMIDQGSGDVIDFGSWERVPFVELPNNQDYTTDLEPIKPLIDSYDKVISGWADDVDDFAEQILVLKGFTGLNRGKELQAGVNQLNLFMRDLKEARAIGLESGSDSGVESLKTEIPVEAKEKLLSLLRRAIHLFGEGIDVTDTGNLGTAPSGVALKFLYSGLDMKAGRLMVSLKSALKDFVWFITKYIENSKGIVFDPLQVLFTITKSMIFNEAEKIDSLNASKDLISEQTILENHPYVQDVAEEMERLKRQRAERASEEQTRFDRQMELKSKEVDKLI